MNDTPGRRRILRYTPYITHIGPRKIGNVPACYTIRCRDDLNASKSASVGVKEERISLPLSYDKRGEDDSQPSCSNAIQQSAAAKTPVGTRRRIDSHTRTTAKDPRYSYPMCYVEPTRRWTYKKDTDNGELYYTPDPFRPVPASKDAPCAVIRMHHAANRIDSIKYRAQQTAANEAASMESANCDKCKLRFFLPYNHMRSRISYAETKSLFDLPSAYFSCPFCHHENEVN